MNESLLTDATLPVATKAVNRAACWRHALAPDAGPLLADQRHGPYLLRRLLCATLRMPLKSWHRANADRIRDALKQAGPARSLINRHELLLPGASPAIGEQLHRGFVPEFGWVFLLIRTPNEMIFWGLDRSGTE